MNKWNDYNGVDSPGFGETDILEVEYRTGRRAVSNYPWMLSGWYWWPRTGGRDIVKWRLTKPVQ